jgi:hypothetical protein
MSASGEFMRCGVVTSDGVAGQAGRSELIAMMELMNCRYVCSPEAQSDDRCTSWEMSTEYPQES